MPHTNPLDSIPPTKTVPQGPEALPLRLASIGTDKSVPFQSKNISHFEMILHFAYQCESGPGRLLKEFIQIAFALVPGIHRTIRICRLWPDDHEQERGLFQRFRVVLQAAVQGEKSAHIQFLDAIFRKMNADLALVAALRPQSLPGR